MINESEVQRLCKKYNIKYKIFQETNIILLDTGLDEWQIKYIHNKNRSYCLLHKNKLRQKSKFHIQRWLRTLQQTIHCAASHKGVLTNLYGSHNTYKNNNIR